VVAVGLSFKSVSPQLHLLRKHGIVKRHPDATYQIAAKGIAAHAKLVASEIAEGAT
jgi:predicted transcriptional regulator